MITETEAEYKLDAGSTKAIPYFALTGELWGVFVNIYEKIDRIITAPHSTMKCELDIMFL